MSELEEKQIKKERKSKTENKQQIGKGWLLSRLGKADGEIEKLFLKEVEKRLSEDFQNHINIMKGLKPGDINEFAVLCGKRFYQTNHLLCSMLSIKLGKIY
ncbi:hypothetical protein NSA56_02775 [Oceanobacillus caeni]|nr:hypothetical protein [Oceanobacillus caeni]MCR1833320.1 hypothetical protein [Oceanobacillus caeni]